jgi:hypothetical protein
MENVALAIDLSHKPGGMALVFERLGISQSDHVGLLGSMMW